MMKVKEANISNLVQIRYDKSFVAILLVRKREGYNRKWNFRKFGGKQSVCLIFVGN